MFEIAKTRDGYASAPTVLASFDGANGAYPIAGLITDAAGDLFGTTDGGGAYDGTGVVFEIAKTGSGYASAPTVLASFDGADGASPYAGLIADAAGDLFGTTYQGGANDKGAVFEIAKTRDGYAGTPTVLVSFNGADGAWPEGALIANAAGDLFGTTYQGGAYGDGAVFEIAKTSDGYASAPTLLASFNGSNGWYPEAALIADAAGNLFGTTFYGGQYGKGEVFEIAKTGDGYASTPTVLFSFNPADWAWPEGGLIADAAGDLFGTTGGGGTNGEGTVFELSNTGFQVTIDLASLGYKSSYEAVWRPATHLLKIIDTANANAVVAKLSIAGTLTGELVTLSSNSGTGTSVSFTPNSLVSAAPGDIVYSNVSGHSYSAYEKLYQGGTFEGTVYFTTGIASPPYTSKAVLYRADGKPESASFNNGMTETWTTNPDGSYQTAFAGVTGAHYTSKTVQYGAGGKLESASFNNGMTETWTTNPDGSYQAAFAGVTGAHYTSETVQYAADGRAESASFSNGMTETWAYNADGSYQTASSGVTGAPYTSDTEQHAADGRAESASFSNGMTETWTYNADGSYQEAFAGVTGQPYTSDTVQYAANGRPESALFSNGMTEVWTFESDGSYEAAFAGVTGAAYTALVDTYNPSGELQTSLTTNTNGTYTLRGHQDGLTLDATEPRERLIGGDDGETFVFSSSYTGLHEILGDFAAHLTGPDADILSLPGSPFNDSFALLLQATTFSSSGATIGLGHDDSVYIPD